jgi:hypothetical protein
VVLPGEKKRGSKSDPQNLPLKIRGSKIAPPEGQISDVQNLGVSHKKRQISIPDKHLQTRGSNSDPQELTPLLYITNKSLTLSERESDFHNFGSSSQALLARELVNKFYSLLTQRPPKAKREKSTTECLELLEEGFSAEQIDYTITWLLRRYPETGSFSRVVHFIDQALRDRDAEQKALGLQQQREGEVERQKVDQHRQEEEVRRIEEVRASLPPSELEALREEATRIVEQEHGPVKFGRDTFIRLKVMELIRARYLDPGRSSQ